MTDREREILGWIRENPMISQQELAKHAGITRSSVAVHISNLMKKGLVRGKGYVLQTTPYTVVCGNAGIELCGIPSVPLSRAEATSGHMSLLPSGVGRNVAYMLSLLGCDVKLITALGEDNHAQSLRQSCRELHIDLSGALCVPGAATVTTLTIANEAGEPQLSVRDTEILNHMTPDFFAGRMDLINKAQICAVDTDLSREALEYLALHCRRPLFAACASTQSAERLRGILGHIHTFAPSLAEAELLTGCRTPDIAAARLLALGVQRVFLCCGAEGVLCADRREMARFPYPSSAPINALGTRDAFLSALVWGWQQELSLRDSALAALSASVICIENPSAINEALCVRSVLERMGAAPQ